MSKTTQVRQQIFTAPAAANNTGVIAAQTLPSSGTTIVSTGFTNPAVPRTIRFKGNATTTQGLIVSITGTDIAGNTITESVTMGGAFATPTDSVNAFATVTSVTFPTRGASSDTISLGFGAALGLDCFTDAYSFVGLTEVGSFVSDATTLSKNVATLNASLDGTTNQAVLYVPSVFPTYSRTWG